MANSAKIERQAVPKVTSESSIAKYFKIELRR
jgi:hypothetical protein